MFRLGMRGLAVAAATMVTAMALSPSAVSNAAGHQKSLKTALPPPRPDALKNTLTFTTPLTAPLQQTWTHLSHAPSLVHSSISAVAYDITTHQTLAAIRPTLRLTPGSVTKLFTSAAALATLGPNFTYKTVVMASPSVKDGHPGPLYLVGGGDPWLEANGRHDLESLAQRVAKVVPSATQVIGVNAGFTPPVYGIGWPEGGITQNYSAGTTALMAERGEVSLWVYGSSVGSPPRVALKFNGTAQDPSYFTIVNRAATGAPGTTDSIQVMRRIGTNQIVVSGHVPASSGAGPLAVSAGNPALFATSLFQTALERAGARVSQPATVVNSLPAGLVTLAMHVSPPLSVELKKQNQFSINQMAENLYRELSAESGGSLAGSATVMTNFTRIAGVDANRVQVDGSGLSPLDQMSAQQVVQLLTYASTQPWFSTFQNSMIQINHPNACGFLCPPYWHYQLPAHSAIWVKPGSLSNQWNLAGYVRAENGDLIAFAILDDGTGTNQNMYSTSPVQSMMTDLAFWPDVPAATPSPALPPVSGTLPSEVNSLMQNIPGMDNGSNVAAAVVNAATGATVFQQSGSQLMRSGLAPRIILDLTALTHLPKALPGVNLMATGPLAQGMLNGSLVLNAQNANLSPSQLQQLAQAVVNHGITKISGPVEYVNPVRGFQQVRWPGGMAWNVFGRGWAPPAAPLLYNFDHAALIISGTTPGKPATLSLSPANVPVHIQNDTTVSATGSPNLSITLKFDSLTFVVSGTVPAGYHGTQPIAPPDPGLYAAGQFENDLAQLGVHVTGTPIGISEAPPGHLIATLSGANVASLVQQSLTMLSLAPDNQLLRALGASAGREAAGLLGGAPSSVGDWTGAALGDYLTPLGIAQALAQQYRNPAAAPLTQELSSQVWTSSSPEQYEAVGYIAGPGQSVYAVVILASGLLWNQHLTPQP